MIIIIVRLLQIPLNYPPFLRNFANMYQYSMKGVVRKYKLLGCLAKLTVNIHPQEFGTYATHVIFTSSTQSNISCPNMFVSPHPKEGSISHHNILLEEYP